MEALPLEGIRIVDLTNAIAGPWCTMILGSFGAEILKIEQPLAQVPPARMLGARRGGFFRDLSPEQRTGIDNLGNLLGPNKYAASLDLRSPEGVALCKELVKVSDVVVENYSGSVMKRFGLDYPKLKEVKEDIILVSMPGYGHGGPYENYLTTGPGIDGMSGMQSLTGGPDRWPLKLGAMYADQSNGLMSAFATVAAIYARQTTGQGQHVEVAMRDTSTQFIGDALFEYLFTGRVPKRIGNKHPIWAPHDAYRCQGVDQWITIAVRNEEEWGRLCQEAGHDEWAKDPRFQTMALRKEHEAELDRLIEEWTSGQDKQQIMERLQKCGVPAGAVLDSQEVFENPHFRARGSFPTVPAQGGPAMFHQLPLRFDGSPAPFRILPPYYGEHTHYIFGQVLGLPQEQIEALILKKVIGYPPSQKLQVTAQH